MVSSAYLRLLIFLPAILIAACASSSLAFHMIYSAYKLNKQGDNIELWSTPFPIWNQSVVLCPALTVASWPADMFLRRQVRWSGIPISLRIFQIVVVHTVKGFCIVNEAEVDVSRIFLLYLWSNGCWQFDHRFHCLFKILLEHLQVFGSCNVEAWLASTFWIYFASFGASLIAQLVKNPPAVQETLVSFLGQEDPLDRG